MAESKKKDKKARIKACRDHYKTAADADRENRRGFIDDMNFTHVPGEQWDQYTKKARTGPNGGEARPMYQFNRLRTTCKRVINNMRANPTAVKVRGSEDGDKDTADILEGLIRNIQNTSNWDAIRDSCAEYQVVGGYAAWRITTDYCDDSAFDQDIKIEALRNPLCLYCDPAAFDQTGADAGWWVYTDKITKDAFKARYPKAEPVSFEDEAFDDDAEWDDEEKVRIAEHWWKEPVTKNIYLLDDGKTIDDEELPDAKTQGRKIVKTRSVHTHDIYSAIYSGDAELTEPAKFASKYFPWIRIYGEYMIIEGKVHWFGLPRNGKDGQRSFNLALTSVIESIASAAVNQNQVWATATQAKELSEHWADAISKNMPVMIYNADPAAPGPPQRTGGATVPVANIQLTQMMGEEIKADSGIFDASLGAQSNETSGKAINARQQQGEIATYNYQGNMAQGERRMGVILIDMIPRVIDTERSIRILGADDAEKYIKVNQPGPNGEVINDLSRGKYDVVVTVGPSFSTKRQEAVEAYSLLAQSNPGITAAAGDLMIKGMDLPYADEIAERIQLLLPPQIQQAISKDKPMPPEVQAAMAQANQAMQQVQEQGQMVQAAAQEAMQEKSAADKAKADLQVAQANLKVQAAELDTSVAQFKQLVAETQAKFAQEQGTNEAGNEREQLAAAVQQALGEIQQQSAEFMQRSLAVMAQIQEAQKPVVITSPPRPLITAIRRENGALIPEYETVQ